MSGIPELPSGIDPGAIPGLDRMLRDRVNQGTGAQQLGSPLEVSRDEQEIPLEAIPELLPPRSPLEEDYSRRAGRPLDQIGYLVFGVQQPVVSSQVGAIPDSYVLGVGDELLIHLRGKVNQSFSVPVDREGTVVLPELPPLAAAGLTFGEFRQQLRAEVGQRLLGTDVFASVARIREIAVTVTGELRRPGVVRLNGLASVVDAILLAGGIKKSGSLRGVQILRQGTVIPVDLYDFVLGRAEAGMLALADGDRIFVPVIGPTVAVTGRIKRPGIFELPPGQDEIAAEDLLDLGGSVWMRGGYRHSVLRIRPNGTQELVELPRLARQTVRSGEILFVEPAANAIDGEVELAGHVRLPGTFPLAAARTLRQLLSGGVRALLPDPYLPFAVVETTDSRTQASRFTKVDLWAVLEGRSNLPLASGDRVYVFSLDDINYLTSRGVIEALQGRLDERANGCAGLRVLARWVRANPRSDLASGQFSTAVRDLVGGDQPCPALFDRVPGLLTFLLQNAILVRGNVLNPGVYPIASREGIQQVMAIARSLSGDRRSSLPQPAGHIRVASAGGWMPVVEEPDLGRALQVAGRPGEGGFLRTSQSTDRRLGGSSVWAPPQGLEIIPATPGAAAVASDIFEIDEPRVAVRGHVRYPGTRSLASAPTLRALVGSPEIYGENPYLLFGIIIRRNLRTLQREVVPFAPAKIIGGDADLPLQDRDIVRIFSFAEVQDLIRLGRGESDRKERDAERREEMLRAEEATQARLQEGTGSRGWSVMGPSGADVANVPPAQGAPFPGMASNPFAPEGSGTSTMPLSARQETMEGLRPEQAAEQADEIIIPREALARLLTDSAIELLGEVVLPGAYPVAGTVTLEELLAAAGGLAPGADVTAVEITRYPLNPATNRLEVDRSLIDLRTVQPDLIAIGIGNTVRVGPLISDRERGFVEIVGEVRRPGRYDIVRGEKLSSVIERAGGLQPTAYPAGAVFTRESVRRTEEAARQRTIQEFHRALIGRISEVPTGTAARGSDLTAQEVSLMTNLMEQLSAEAVVGRMVVEANPLVLEQRPELDITLEGGDRLVIPRTPQMVFVSGEVFNPGAQQFALGMTAAEYIAAAGGVTEAADRSNAFLVRPDGSARQISVSSWGRSGGETIPPGSWIVVPRDLTPFRFRELATVVTGIVRDLAVSAASLAVITRNN